MDGEALLIAVRREGNALLAAAESDPTASIEHCPDWDIAAMVEHVAGVWTFMTAQLAAASPDSPTRPERDESPAAERLDRLVTALAETDPQTPCWNWCAEDGRRAGWIGRRMAHENAIHRWDVENAVGEAPPIDGDLARDGVDEILDVAWRYQMRGPVTDYPNSTLHLHCTDGEGEWLLSSEDDRLVVAREHAKGDVAARGTASELFLLVWGRRPAGIEVFGDEASLAAWLALTP